MSKEIRLIEFATSIEDEKELWQDCVIKAITNINTDGNYIYLMELNIDTAEKFALAAENLANIFKSKGIDNIVFVPKNMINLKKVEILHTS